MQYLASSLSINFQKEQNCGLSMHSFTVAIINGSYMFQLESSHQQAVYVRSIKGNFIAVLVEDISALHIKV
jgi:hypothetical protein